MEGGSLVRGVAISKAATSKRGTPNKHWKPNFDNFLIPVLVKQARKDFKLNKSIKWATFVHVASAMNAKFNTNFSVENV